MARISLSFVACVDDFAGGLLWSNSRRNVSVTQPCSELHPSFRSGVNIERQCLNNGSWSSVDMSNCTMFRNSYPVVVVYFTVTTDNTYTGDSAAIISNVSIIILHISRILVQTTTKLLTFFLVPIF